MSDVKHSRQVCWQARQVSGEAPSGVTACKGFLLRFTILMSMGICTKLTKDLKYKIKELCSGKSRHYQINGIVFMHNVKRKYIMSSDQKKNSCNRHELLQRIKTKINLI
uniref:Uncharacterized protein n=1 Tax=Anguilla anguilla TaxID=7936 RepID=A0A0E9WI47_ANGAN